MENLRLKYIEHHNVCPYCRNVKTHTETLLSNKVRACSCGGKWIPGEPTEENLQRFIEFSQQTTYIF